MVLITGTYNLPSDTVKLHLHTYVVAAVWCTILKQFTKKLQFILGYYRK